MNKELIRSSLKDLTGRGHLTQREIKVLVEIVDGIFYYIEGLESNIEELNIEGLESSIEELKIISEKLKRPIRDKPSANGQTIQTRIEKAEATDIRIAEEKDFMTPE